MKLCSFSVDGRSSFGLVTDNGIVDLGRRFPAAVSLRAFLADDGLAKAAEIAADTPADYAVDVVTFEPVITDPDKIICIGLNYRDHVAETGREVTEKPVLFSRYPGSQVGHGQPLIKPLESDQFDYEGELAVIIGKRGRRIPETDELSHVAGYACYNDGSIRDWQRHTSQFLPGKPWGRLSVCSQRNSIWADVYYWTSEVPQGPTIREIVIGTQVETANGSNLAGTTGNDGVFTIAAGTDGKIYFENRRGGTTQVSWHDSANGGP